MSRSNMKVAPKLYFLVGVLSLILIAIGVLGLQGMKTTGNSLDEMYRDQLLPVELLSEVKDLRRENMQEMLLIRVHDPLLPESKIHEADHPITKHSDIVEANRVRNERLWKAYMAARLTPEERQLADSYVAARDKYRDDGQNPVMTLVNERRFEEASLHISKEMIPLFNETAQKLDELMQKHIEVANNEKDQANANYTRTRNLAIASIAGGILLALGLGWWIIRGITSQLATSISAISSSAAEIAATVIQHERTASQQAAAANETSATIDELSASSRQSAEQAANTAAVSEKVSAATVQGGEAILQAIAAMTSLKGKIAATADQILHLGEQTSQIGGIATLLKDLAGQINMLALNAAVEAARAGEHGKGFAVVAAEVRKLADQSRKSAEQASVLVADVQKATNASIMMTEEGTHSVAEVTQLSEKVSELFDSLAGMAGSVNENAQQVLLNARQQSAALNQVVGATNSIATGAKETADAIGQTRISVQQLNEAAENLKAIA